jgi:hypothetical protein
MCLLRCNAMRDEGVSSGAGAHRFLECVQSIKGRPIGGFVY